MARLTSTQKRIIEEIDEIAADIGISHQAIVEEFEGSDSLTELLTFARRRLIIATIVTDYTFFDEMLSSIMHATTSEQDRSANSGERSASSDSTTTSLRGSTFSRNSRL